MMKKLSVGKIIDATWTYALLLIVAFILFSSLAFGLYLHHSQSQEVYIHLMGSSPKATA